ncbi:MAG: AcrR family transcriptional regulator [Francisellaceae bacterium]|jgi:AcrR family transcriptional regulator
MMNRSEKLKKLKKLKKLNKPIKSKDIQYERKKLDVLEACWQAILRVGIDKVTMREIAFELDATTGTLVHYFRTKDDILLQSLMHLFNVTFESIEDQVKGKSGLNRIEHFIYATLPLDKDGEIGWRIWLSYLRASISDDEISIEHQRKYAHIQDWLLQEIKNLDNSGEIKKELNLDLEVRSLGALIDGIGVGYIVNPTRFTYEMQRALVKRHINTFLAA